MNDFKIGQQIGRWFVNRIHKNKNGIVTFVEFYVPHTHSIANTHNGVLFAYRKQVGIGQFHFISGVVNSREEFEKL